MSSKKQPPTLSPPKAPDPIPDAGYIIAGGPSLTGFNWELLDDKFVVGINRAYEVLPNADVIYCTDEDFYNRHIDEMKNHSARIIKGCTNLKTKYHECVETFHVTPGKGFNMQPGKLYHGRNSTFAALNMLVQWGFKKIYILGVDMKWGKAGDKTTSHWHDGHKRVDGEATYKSFASAFDNLDPQMKKLNVEVINVNNDTQLKVFPIVTYEEHFGENCFLL